MADKLLLVEDDLKLGEFVAEFLRRNKFEVEWVTNGSEVATKLQKGNFNLMLLDVMLPGKSGFDVCREVRNSFHLPIVMLTARSNDFDQIRGLESGADDYIYKPVEPLVLLARIKMHLRRAQNTKGSRNDHSSLVFDGLKINLRNHSVYLDDKLVPFTEGEFDLLKVMAMHAGQIMSRENLFELVIGRPYDGLDRTVDGRISRIRKKINCTQEAPRYIKAIRSKGYLFFANQVRDTD